MKKHIITKGDYTLLKVADGFIVINNKGAYSNHTHVNDVSLGTVLVDLAYNQIVPSDKRTIYSLLRIVTDNIYRWELNQMLRLIKQKRRRN